MKTILLHVDNDTGMEGRFQTSLSLARDLEAHLTCLQVTPTTSYMLGEATASPATFDLLMRSIEEPARNQRAALEARLASEMVSWDWRVRSGDAVREILDQARLVDVIVVSGGAGSDGPDPTLAGTVALHAQLPVLAIPAGTSGIDLSGPMMIAWNGSHEAANALRHSLPLIRRAASVHLVAIEESGATFSANDAAIYLSRSDVHAEVHERRAEPSIQEALKAAAREIGAACIVMGAYGHSRVRELVFGGVTRHMLQSCRVPLFLSH